MERISDTSIRLTATSSTTNTTQNGTGFGFSNAGLFDVSPTTSVPVASDNTLQINGQTITANGGGGFTGFSTASPVTGTLSATGSVVLTWGDGQIKGTGNSFDIVHSIPSNIICQVGIVADSQTAAASIPTLSEWGLLILALLLMTFGTLYLVQPNWRERLEQE
ncbi:MAG: IPTL-CTERM sorting domain-containing protein [Chitinophagales bacterium]